MGGGWLTPRPGRSTSEKKPTAYCTGGWVGPMARLDGYV
jgi:hypothetical protein